MISCKHVTLMYSRYQLRAVRDYAMLGIHLSSLPSYADPTDLWFRNLGQCWLSPACHRDPFGTSVDDPVMRLGAGVIWCHRPCWKNLLSHSWNWLVSLHWLMIDEKTPGKSWLLNGCLNICILLAINLWQGVPCPCPRCQGQYTASDVWDPT